MVIHSGGAFNAPTLRLSLVRKSIAACKAQHQGIAVAMKIGKENMAGWYALRQLLTAARRP
ncbi:hypothetical protein KCP70_10965 [Salmonella enterica subsp. enterica]|nr:hypothetical protein KCP70_10965 [Salmonella enterica subsp. enterica]